MYDYLVEHDSTEEIIDHYHKTIALAQAIFGRARFVNKLPSSPDLIIDTGDTTTLESAVAYILEYLQEAKLVPIRVLSK
jgi:hypothetical protein